ncbi:DNA polymerase I [Novosphingobium aromaticivorans DSM 12444]|uniref:DNA polymerase I n=1 Tax=Novosphingobium aromaticivorans (strain ATCC 700278 / DSM 12444 / CCUG 56034 / CIP 105152 / NBRC 16084 / F199) TaxID=279238 RepID=Q2GBP7_NOVAD|nr:DNA polymerase I [Novosphingobium aromaticivorans]ABD24726.1 DNA polymerase I [Novosphingobium aromaticivorans DSM 12444]SCY19458.1 DNA polymerase I [Novosphingobium aromaticivorans]
MDEKQHLYLVDGSAYIFRAYHRLPPLTNPRGVPVGAVYGYTTMLWKLAEDLHKADGPTHLAVILDKAGTSFRNDLYDQYKANRPPPPEDLVPQFPLIRDATRAFSLACIEEDALEADDLIASYARAATLRGWDVTIVSSDKDLMQLVGKCATGGGCIDMLDTMKNQRIDIPEVVEKFGVPPEKVGDVLALMGDSVDNVPGIRGIGPKTATKLIQEHGDLESALAAAPTMKAGKLRESLIEQAEMARLSRVLVALKEDCPLPVPIEDFKLGQIPRDPLAAFLEEHGFTSLLRRLDDGKGSPGPKTQLNPAKPDNKAAPAAPEGNRQALPSWPAPDLSAYACVQSMGELQQWIARAFEARVVAIDTETSALDAMRADLVGVSLALGPNDACYIPLGHGGSDMFAEKPLQVDRAEALAALKPLLESDAVLKVGQNIKYDLNILARQGIMVSPIDDTMVMSFCLDAGRSETGLAGHGMDELSERHLLHTTMKFKELCGTGKKAISFAEVPLADATRYAAEDADVTWRLHRLFQPRLAGEGGTRIYQKVDRPLIPVVAMMERNGIKVDRERLSGLSTEFAAQIARLEGVIHEKCGMSFTIGSPKQLGEVLFDKLGYKGGKKGKTGQYSTDQSVLEGLAAQGAEVATLVLEWRQLSKLKSTYTDALQAAINPHTGRVHTSYSLVGAQTGRLSSNEPNLQNIPIRTEIGRQIRDAFVAEPGNVLLAADYSQIELRLAAHMADVPALKEAFAAGEDIHARTAMEMFGTVDRDTRGRAKTINFAILYGISRWGLGGRLGVSADEAQAMIDRYFERFPGIQRYIHETLESVRERGYSETLFGRKTWFPRISSKNQAERQGSERAAINAPIQGTSADIIKRAMARMMPALTEAGLGHVRMLLQVHDELVFELPQGDVEAAKPVIERVMATAAEPAVKLSVPLGVEIGTGLSWGAAH